MRVVGLMSGTSFDGIEAAAGEFDVRGDELTLRPLGSQTFEYDHDMHDSIARLLPPNRPTLEAVCRADNDIGRAFAGAAEAAITDMCDGRADLIASHGQTIFHLVEDGRAKGSLQVGEAAWIAERTGVPVISNLRARDIACGGQGAPLVSLFDVLLLPRGDNVLAALNIGGIANITVIPPVGDPFAFDVGPGNCLIDSATAHFSGGTETFDADGTRARSGRVHERLLSRLLADPYYEKSPPKSTGREAFHIDYLIDAIDSTSRGIGGDDAIATVTALTARTIADACRRYDIERVIASGGGTRNSTLMHMLTDELADVSVSSIEEWGIPADAKEAHAFAMLGYLSACGLPGNVPSCTGAAHPVILGDFTPGEHGFPGADAGARSPTSLRIVTGDKRL